MAITVNVKMDQQFTVKASAKEVFDLLADVPASAQHFPNVDQLVPLGKNAYRWQIAKIGTEKFNLQTLYACTYAADRKQGLISWTPIKGEGNALISGHWQIIDNKNSTTIHFEMHGELTLPVSSLLRMIVAPLAAAENKKINTQYLANLTKHFGDAA
jgi:ribosome-associated toxin RatA of RatAB toxin-antitoxin module